MESFWLECLLIVVAILLNGFFAASEIALVSARPARLTQLRREAVQGAATALELKQDPETFLATIQIAITLVSTLASAVGGATVVAALAPWIAQLPLPGAARGARLVSLGLVVLGITYVSLVVGELSPKALALRNPERIACFVARPVAWLGRCSSGLVRFLTASMRLVVRLLGLRRRDETSAVSEEEVRHLLREGAARGIFEKVEEELVHRVFEFADTTVREVMVPRTRVRALDVTTPPEEVLPRAVEIGHSRIPVYRESLEHPVGVVIIKDLLRCSARGEPPVLERLLHPPLFIPEMARVSELLRQFQQRRQNLAMVVDEYGGVVGVVSVEDVVEEIVGELREERERPDETTMVRAPDGSYLLDGGIPIRELQARLRLPIPESPDYQTLAGFLIHTLETIPQPGVTMVAGGYRFTVMEMEGPRIVRVKARAEPR